MSVYETEQQFIDLRSVHFSEIILDVGGGGEGVITRHSGSHVVVIDIRKDELEEIPDSGLRIVMDARELGFLDNSFTTITCFFSLMFMSESTKNGALKELYRVLKPDGVLWIWDVTIPAEAKADVFVVQLRVQISDDEIATPGYGIGWTEGQSVDSIIRICEDAGFSNVEVSHSDQSFVLCVRKQ